MSRTGLGSNLLQAKKRNFVHSIVNSHCASGAVVVIVVAVDEGAGVTALGKLIEKMKRSKV